MKNSSQSVAAAALLASVLLASGVVVAQVDTGTIRLGNTRPEPDPDASAEAPPVASGDLGGRRGFDRDAFQFRLESYWFRRKALLAEGRVQDAQRESEQIRGFCREEGVERLTPVAGAVLVEAGRYLEEGSYEKALASLDFAETFDPGRPQVNLMRAVVSWKAGEGVSTAVRELLAALRGEFVRAWSTLRLLNHLAVACVIALLGVVAVFAALMAFKYQGPFRHEIEEWSSRRGLESLAPAMGWALLLLPLWTFLAAGWLAVYWILVTVRFMRRGERLAAVGLLLALSLCVPAYRVAVAVYGMMSDPAVRTTLESAQGGYSPDRVVALQALVDTHPDDPVYHFLLAGLYENGGYLEEAHDAYRRVAELDPGNHEVYINIGNIFFRVNQHGEAIRHYLRATELEPTSVLAYYNMYLAQSESFKFKEAEASLRAAQAVDSDLTARLLARRKDGEHGVVLDARADVGSVWTAALGGGSIRQSLGQEDRAPVWGSLAAQLLNPLSLVALASVLGCAVMIGQGRGRQPARRCIRCGQSFCNRCHAEREGREYCSQCLHLFVLGDGLAPETKTRKLYEVERFARTARRLRTLASLILPGAAHLLRGRAAQGFLLLLLWVALLLLWRPEMLAPLERALGSQLHLAGLRPGSVPQLFKIELSGFLALIGAIAVWVSGNFWIWRGREV